MTTILLVDDDPLEASWAISTLKRRFGNVSRAADAAQAFCLIEQPNFAAQLKLVISSHHCPGIGGPVFVAELRSRMAEVPILVLGRDNESPADYPAPHVVFLPRSRAAELALKTVEQLLRHEKHAAA
jgi:CheY-like chemotaxis protein